MALLELAFYLLTGIFTVLLFGVVIIAQGMSSVANPFLKISLRCVMIATILFSIIYGIYVFQRRDIVAYEKLLPQKDDIKCCQSFIQDYPNSEKIANVESFIREQYQKELMAAIDTLSLIGFINKYSNNYWYHEKYKHTYIEKAISTLNSLREHQRKKQEEEEIKKEKKAWNSDAGAWETAQKQNTVFAYRKYISLYPRGKHVKEAEKRSIDVEVSDIFASGDYSILPPLDKMSYGTSSSSRITISNDTQYVLTLLYSGRESKRIVIAPRKTESIRVKSGRYRIVASVGALNVRNFARTENLTGGEYKVSYYIQSSKY